MSNFPRGVIVEWFGAIVDIPTGWTLCNGANGTPDLRNRFIVGAGGSFNVDDTGGNVNHDHDFTGSSHYHTIGAGGQIASGPNFSDTTDPASATGTTDPANGLPPYHALAHIMKT